VKKGTRTGNVGEATVVMCSAAGNNVTNRERTVRKANGSGRTATGTAVNVIKNQKNQVGGMCRTVNV